GGAPMPSAKSIVVAFLVVMLAGCTTPYGKMGLTGGYSEKQVSENVWHVHYLGNGFTTMETVQTMWLYRCASLTLEKGFAGFEIVTPVTFSELRRGRHTLLQRTGGSFSSNLQAITPFVIGQAAANAAMQPMPTFDADIRLLNAPFTAVP